ncbi:MAG: 6,7-dimethyl-8-ribityllumazine synthase [Myxococcota bacterium]|nr:6,7-dimethyl-8-ribityllumazine synthase [Myxococcota bacterium]
MPRRVYEGDLIAKGESFAILVSRWNDLITSRLLEGALDSLRRHGVNVEANVDVIWAPGSYELPLVAQKIAKTGRYAAVIVLACVIKGGTPHFDYIAAEVTKGLANVGLQLGLPISFGVLTTNSIEQAIERAGTKMGNKGCEAALAALEMVNLLSGLED